MSDRRIQHAPMTLALSMCLHDGVVLAADSATSLVLPSPSGGQQVVNIYNNANKIFNLHKRLPIGCITWGAGSIGSASISTLAKDLRRRFMGHDHDHADWEINADAYTIEAVASQARKFFYDELYLAAHPKPPGQPSVGFVVAGYSAGGNLPEEFQILIHNGACGPPQRLRPPSEVGLTWFGQPAAIQRLILGFDGRLASVLAKAGLDQASVAAILASVRQELQAPIINAPMPIQDAIDLSEFLVYVTSMYERFMPGAATVGGPIEVAAVTKHEGFKWVKRKHYYDRAYNPEERP